MEKHIEDVCNWHYDHSRGRSKLKIIIRRQDSQSNSQAFLIHTHDTSDKCKDADHLLELVEVDIDYIEEVLGAKIIAWYSDAGGDSRGMRVQLVKKPKRMHIIQLDCYGHQVCARIDIISAELTVALRRFNWWLETTSSWTAC
jgi:hypothetical protein